MNESLKKLKYYKGAGPLEIPHEDGSTSSHKVICSHCGDGKQVSQVVSYPVYGNPDRIPTALHLKVSCHGETIEANLPVGPLQAILNNATIITFIKTSDYVAQK